MNIAFQKRSLKKIRFLKKLIDQNIPKAEIKEKFIDEFKCHQSTFYEWWIVAYDGHLSGKMLIDRYERRKIRETRRILNKNKDKCYFCGSKDNLNKHHLIYDLDNELIVVLCRSCHTKIDRLDKYVKFRKNLKSSTKIKIYTPKETQK